MAVINVLHKANQVLDALAAADELSAQELATLLDEPRTSVYRLLGSMQELNWVTQGTARGTFRVGVRMFQIGANALGGLDVRQIALPELEALLDLTGHTVFLCVREGYEGLCVERLDGRYVQTFELRLGRSLPLHVGGASRALLAFNPSLWDDYIEHVPLKSYTSFTPATPAKLRETLTAELSRGVVISDQEVTLGIAAVGAPIYDHTGACVAGISMSGISQVLLSEDYQRASVTAIREAADRISTRLGHQPKENRVIATADSRG